MASVTFAVSATLKSSLEHFSWVNWSEVAREEVMKDLKKSEELQRFLKIVAKSKFTEKDAVLLSEKVKASLHQRLKKEGLL